MWRLRYVARLPIISSVIFFFASITSCPFSFFRPCRGVVYGNFSVNRYPGQCAVESLWSEFGGMFNVQLLGTAASYHSAMVSCRPRLREIRKGWVRCDHCVGQRTPRNAWISSLLKVEESSQLASGGGGLSNPIHTV